jgi:hypothetical protein
MKREKFTINYFSSLMVEVGATRMGVEGMIQMIVVGILQHSILIMKTLCMIKHGTGHHLQYHTNLRVCSKAG